MAKSIQELIVSGEADKIPPVQNWMVVGDVEQDYDPDTDTLWVAFSESARNGSYFHVAGGYHVIMVEGASGKWIPVGLYITDWYRNYCQVGTVKYFWSNSRQHLKLTGSWDDTILNLVDAILESEGSAR